MSAGQMRSQELSESDQHWKTPLSSYPWRKVGKEYVEQLALFLSHGLASLSQDRLQDRRFAAFLISKKMLKPTQILETDPSRHEALCSRANNAFLRIVSQFSLHDGEEAAVIKMPFTSGKLTSA